MTIPPTTENYMSEEKKPGLNYWGKPSKTGRQWNEQKGRLATLSKEERSEIARKGSQASAAKRTARRKMKEMLANPDGFREEAIEAILEIAPDAMEKLAQTIYQKALEGDKFAIDMATKMFGLDAPKKAELKIVEEMDAEEAANVIKNALKNSVAQKD